MRVKLDGCLFVNLSLQFTQQFGHALKGFQPALHARRLRNVRRLTRLGMNVHHLFKKKCRRQRLGR